MEYLPSVSVAGEKVLFKKLQTDVRCWGRGLTLGGVLGVGFFPLFSLWNLPYCHPKKSVGYALARMANDSGRGEAPSPFFFFEVSLAWRVGRGEKRENTAR